MAREVAATWLGNLKAEVRVGPHRVAVDEPPDHGGDDTGPTPTELVLAALTA
jgi:putative redox protein